MVEQIRRLVDRGFLEVVLTGVDLTSWGADLPGAPRLGDLVMRILRLVPDLPRLRISSIDSIEADANLMQAIATEPRLRTVRVRPDVTNYRFATEYFHTYTTSRTEYVTETYSCGYGTNTRTCTRTVPRTPSP